LRESLGGRALGWRFGGLEKRRPFLGGRDLGGRERSPWEKTLVGDLVGVRRRAKMWW